MNKLLIGIFIVLLAFIIGGTIYYLSYSPPPPQTQPTSNPTQPTIGGPQPSPTNIRWSEKIFYSPLNQKTFENKDASFKHIKVTEGVYSEIPIQTNVALGVKTTEKTPQDGSSGFIIDNNLSGRDLRSFAVFYNPEHKNWFTSYYKEEGGQSEFIEALYDIPYGPACRFSLMIDAQGEAATIMLTDGRMKKLNLKAPFYSKNKELYFKIQTAPFSSVVVSEFSILTPLSK